MDSPKDSAAPSKRTTGPRLVVAALGLGAALFMGAPRAGAVVCQSPCVAQGDKVVLRLFWSPQREDNMTVATADSRNAATAAGYQSVRDEALVFRNYQPGLIPLRLFWHAGRGDHYTVAGLTGQQAVTGFYTFVRLEGWIHPSQQPGTVPLYLYWNAAREDNFVTASSAGIASAEAAGYVRAGIEGYVFPAP